ncbi:hypothetical protein [Musicola paradisiaca]|nr:hypothetical protein [Musicola paradisiaca]
MKNDDQDCGEPVSPVWIRRARCLRCAGGARSGSPALPIAATAC